MFNVTKPQNTVLRYQKIPKTLNCQDMFLVSSLNVSPFYIFPYLTNWYTIQAPNRFETTKWDLLY